MRRTNTDYKFDEENINIHYLSTHSLKSNYHHDTQTQTNVEFDYYFNHSCHIDDHDICHKTILSNTYESGIGSSISSIDMHSNHSCNTEESTTNSLESEPLLSLNGTTNNYNFCGHFDCHDLPPVTEEDDSDSILGILNIAENDNKHLDILPWHDSCLSFKPCKHTHRTIFHNPLESVVNTNDIHSQWWDRCNVIPDDSCVVFSPLDNCDNCIEKPWISADSANFHPVLSSICHISEDCILKSKTFLSHFTHTNLISDKAIMYKVFQKRHSIRNGPSIFTYNINSLMTMDGSHETNLEDEELLQVSLSD